MRFIRALAAAVALLASAAGHAAAEPALNRQGFWSLEAIGASCQASMSVEGGGLFMLLGDADGIGFGAGVDRTLEPGKVGRLATEAYSFDFTPTYGKHGDVVYLDDKMNARALAALRLARQVTVSVDGKLVLGVKVEGTGFEDLLDAIAACGQGKSGWWGAGAGAGVPEPERPTYNNEGLWEVAADGAVCTAAAAIDGGTSLVLLAANGGRDLAVGAGGMSGKRGRQGVVETDAFRFRFKPAYDGDDYFQTEEFLDSQSVLALRRAKWLRIEVDGREMADANLEGSSFPEVLTSLTDCAAGRSGWWGAGAKAP